MTETLTKINARGRREAAVTVDDRDRPAPQAQGWRGLLAPLAGDAGDAAILQAAQALARPFGAAVTAMLAVDEAAERAPWLGEGFMGGVQVQSYGALQDAAGARRTAAAAAVAALGDASVALEDGGDAPGEALALAARLADLVVVSAEAGRGRGPLTQPLRTLLGAEQAPVWIAPDSADAQAPRRAVIAWNGGREAARAVRAALPWLRLCDAVTVVSLLRPPLSPDPLRLADWLLERGVRADAVTLDGPGDVAERLLEAAEGLGAELLVAGAFGHMRVEEFIFGSVTRRLLSFEGSGRGRRALLLSH